MNVKARKTKKQVNIQNSSINVLSNEEISRKINAVEKNLKASTWRELETNGKFRKNDKLTFISDEMLIIGCDIGSEIHYIRAIDTRGRELSKTVFHSAIPWKVLQVQKHGCWTLQQTTIKNRSC